MRALWRQAAHVLAHPWRRVALALAGFVLILGIDRWLLAGPHTLIATGIADETAHFTTMAIFLLAFPSRNDGFILGCLIGSVAIDLDHIPLFLGSDLLTRQTNRPFTHSVCTILIVVAAAAMARGFGRSMGLGVAVGLAVHFLRDMATSTAGVPLLWPFATTGFMLPYPLYAATLFGALAWGGVAAARITGREKRRGPGR
ncbi:MAG: metal-dependent hydrolase [Thermomicrobiales bacterium]|nr:metal-dependent hydrolase [Thermomicrobiales bacterium]MCA9877103.1 metal-dependent hydrolase [Thermomicrobiales bacterium]